MKALHPLHLVLGYSLWAAWFVLVYGGASLGCALAPPEGATRSAATPLNAGLLMLSLATVALLALFTRQALRRLRALPLEPQAAGARFMATLAAALHGTAALSTAVVALPLLFLPPCL